MTSVATSPPPPSTEEEATASLRSITVTLSDLASSSDEDYSCDPPRRFTALVRRLQLLFREFASFADLSSPPALTALRGIASDLEASRAPLSVYRRKSRILVLINCSPLCSSLCALAFSIASSLALLGSTLSPFPELRKKAADLSRDLLHSVLRVTDNEERVYRMLQKEAEVRPSSKAVHSAILMDLARALGTDPCDHAKLAEHIRQLRSDLSSGCSSVTERKILYPLQKIFDSWSSEPCMATALLDADFEENAQIPPFKSFICPLTKEVMKDPVVLESSQNYDRLAILKWFERCREDGRVPTCPMTGQEQRTMDLKRNIGLAGAIEEWVNRNIEVQIKVALQCLGEGGLDSLESVEKVLDSVYRISEEHPESRYRVRNARIVDLVVQMLKELSKKMGPNLRWKALMAMLKDEESKLIMLKEGITRLVIRILSETSEKEREYALRILLDFSADEEFSSNLALEKGALYLLTSIAGNSDQPTLSNLAEDVLKNMERVEGNIEYLAKEGRYQPLLIRLFEDMVATHVRSGQGIKIIVSYLEHSENTQRSDAIRLMSLLSEKMGQVLVEELRASGKLPFLKERLLDAQCSLSEKAEIACVLANLPVVDDEVTNILGPELLTWTVTLLKMQRYNSLGRNTKDARSIIDGLLGLLLHYSRSHVPQIISLIQETQLMVIFQEQLSNHSNQRAKQRGALGLKYLSESATLSSARGDLEPQPPSGCCTPFVILCGKTPMVSVPCPFHNVACTDNSSFCLLKANAIKPLIKLMDDDKAEVQVAAVEALLTLLMNNSNLKKASEKLNELGLFKAAVFLFKEVGPGELQERVVLMVVRFLQLKNLAEQYSTDSDLVKTLVEALKYGNANTRAYAQDALQNLNQISGIGGRNSS